MLAKKHGPEYVSTIEIHQNMTLDKNLDFFLKSRGLYYFLNYESMLTHLQETWKIQKKVTYSSTKYYNYF